MRSGSVTHSFDMGQRFMNLSFTQSGDTLRVHAPANRNIAPPGQYLLFVFDKAGVPSVAQIVELDGTSSSGTTAVQTGSVTLAQRTRGQWVTVGFRQPFTHTPVVSVGAPSNHDAAPVMARVRNVTAHSFDLKLDEWSPLDGRHELETVSYIAAEPGRHRLGGVTLEAGSLTAGSAWRGATFAGAFGAAPVVLPQVASTFDASAVNVRLTAVHAKGFRVRLQVHEAAERAGRRHGEETVHYIALSGGRGTLDGHPIAVGATKVNVTDRWRGISFPRRLASPSLLAADQTAGQLDPVTVRYRALNSSGVMVRMQEEQSYDRETRHGAERVGWVAIGTR